MKTLLTMILLTGFTLAGADVRAADAALQPSEVTVLINNAMRYQPALARKVLTEPLLARMAVPDDTETEQFLRGEVHFLNLDPELARDAFWAFRMRDDILGRVATQRLLIIRINAFAMVDELLGSDIGEYHKRFPVRPDDRFGITFAVSRTAALLADQGRADEALDLVIDEVRLHDKFDSPYTVYRLPAQFMEMARKIDRENELQDLRDWVVSNFEQALQQRLEADAELPPPTDKVAGVVFRSMLADQEMDKYDWTAAFMRMRDQL